MIDWKPIEACRPSHSAYESSAEKRKREEFDEAVKAGRAFEAEATAQSDLLEATRSVMRSQAQSIAELEAEVERLREHEKRATTQRLVEGKSWPPPVDSEPEAFVNIARGKSD